MKYPVYILFLIIAAAGIWPLSLRAQLVNDEKISLDIIDRPLKEVLAGIQAKSGRNFIYNDRLISAYRHISLKADNRTVSSVLDEVLGQTSLQYLQQDNRIIISAKDPLNTSEETVQQDFSVTGIVTDEKGTVLPGATVFLTNSKRITSTNDQGSFRLSGLQPGTHELVVKMLGFYTYSRNVIIGQPPPDLTVRLKIKNLELNQVVIQGRPDPVRASYLELFKQYFIGESVNSQECEFINPEVLTFRYNKRKNILQASSEEFLIIENYSLGYRISYLINKFELDLRHNIIVYQGFPYFEELPASDAQLQQWELNRQKAYEGSAAHFFRSVFDPASPSDFSVYLFPKKRAPDIFTEWDLFKIKPVRADFIFTVVDKNTRELNPAGNSDQTMATKDSRSLKLGKYIVYVVYTPKKEPWDFIASGRHIIFPFNVSSGQVSTIQPLLNRILIDKNGGFLPESMLFRGYWSWESMADMLPYDYKLPDPVPLNTRLLPSSSGENDK